jgi:[ribosomal protein S5]-alanine N-acetyltransferase
VRIDCRLGLPVLRVPSATLREPRLADAPALFARLTTPPVSQYISTPPSSPLGFERFVGWIQRERYLGRHVCLAIVPDGEGVPVGMIQVQLTEAGFGTAEWGFALSEEHWGTGLFMTCANAVLDFAFRDLSVHRLEARVSVANVRGNRVLQKLGALREGTLRQSFANHLRCTDQSLWALNADEWLAAHPAPQCVRDRTFEQDPETARVEIPRAAAPWRTGFPDLRGDHVTLRGLRSADAGSLARLFADPDVRRYIAVPPASTGDVARFVQWSHGQRARGTSLSFGVVPDGVDAAIGVFYLHEREAPFRTAEWGFVVGRPYWSTGIFDRSAEALLTFAFGTLGVQRLEARVMAVNGRANAVLRRLGATEEGLLRRSFLLGGEYHDDVLWALLADDWHRRDRHPRPMKAPLGPRRPRDGGLRLAPRSRPAARR